MIQMILFPEMYKDKDWLRDKYHKEKLSVHEIAKVCGCSRGSISHWLKKLNIARRSSIEGETLFFKKQEKIKKGCNKSWLEEKYINERLCMEEIANICEVSRGTIGNWLKKFRIPIISGSERFKGKDNPNFGNHWSEEARRKMSERLRGENSSGEYLDKEWLYQKYIIEKLSSGQIAKLCKVHDSTILFNLKKNNIPIQKRPPYFCNANYNICLICGKRFKASHKNRKTCSRKCGAIRQSIFLTKKHIKKICQYCGKEFEVLPSQEKRKTCSRECGGMIQRREKIKKKCEYCGEIYEVIPALEDISRFCKMECRNKWQSQFMAGEGNITYGTHFSEETKEKIRIRQLKYWNNNPDRKKETGKIFKELWKDPIFVNKVIDGWNRRPSKPELFFDDLTPNNVRYVGNGSWWRPTKRKYARNPDFKITGQNKVIEIYGDYWHRNDDPNDLIQEYKEIGLECIIFWESEVYNETKRVIKEVEDFVKI